MPHCQICDFCETTNTPSNYYTEFPIHNNTVTFHDDTQMWLCTECRAGSRANLTTYRSEQEVKKIIDTERQQQDVPKKSPSLSEV